MGTSELVRELPARIYPAIEPLLVAIEYAEQTGCCRWDFAVEIDLLVALDLQINDFRWLVQQGLIQHRRETTLDSSPHRTFECTGDMTFPVQTCFVLTDRGISLAQEFRKLLQRNRWIAERLQLASTEPTPGRLKSTAAVPQWDSQRRVLGLNGTVVKTFKWEAMNQQTVLNAFEEEGWPARIDDPLPPHPDQNSKRRLSDTIKCLNRKQEMPIIHFRGDGTGEGVIWEFADLPGSDTFALSYDM